ncbi:hypothetical protein ACFRCQ_09970 [Cytobacillus firmus]|uniref:hypothetical protein n=1 Tax=Cytobacillus firmus TaxID=1399 RepID=UPI0036A81FF7
MQTQLYVHPWYKEETFSIAKVDPIENYLNKPEGGLWSSTYDEEFGSEWVKSEFVALRKV